MLSGCFYYWEGRLTLGWQLWTFKISFIIGSTIISFRSLGLTVHFEKGNVCQDASWLLLNQPQGAFSGTAIGLQRALLVCLPPLVTQAKHYNCKISRACQDTNGLVMKIDRLKTAESASGGRSAWERQSILFIKIFYYKIVFTDRFFLPPRSFGIHISINTRRESCWDCNLKLKCFFLVNKKILIKI